MAPQLTLYGSPISPFVEKVEVALKAGNIPYKFSFIDLRNKPAFFTEQINPAGKVPAIAYGGPEVAPDQPSPLSVKLTESNVILEFLADAYPEANLLPTDPVQRARARLFIDAVSRKYRPSFLVWAFHHEPDPVANHLEGIEFVQSLLPKDATFAAGDRFSIADACIVPYAYRLQLSVRGDVGRFPVGDGPRFGELLRRDPKYARFVAYVGALMAHPAVKAFYASKEQVKKPLWTKLMSRGSSFVLPASHFTGGV